MSAIVNAAIVVLTITTIMLGQTRAASQLSTADWRTDLDRLQSEVEGRHPAPYHAVAREEFAAALDDVAGAADRRSQYETIVEIARVMSLLEETHSYLAWPSPGDLVAFRQYPFSARKFADGVFVTDAAAPYDLLVNTEIIAFGDQPITQVLDDLKLVTGADNEYVHDFIGPRRLSLVELIAALGYADRNGRLVITVRDLKNRTLTQTIEPADTVFAKSERRSPAAIEQSLFWRMPENTYWFESLPSHDALYIQLNAVAEKEEESFQQFADRVAGAIESTDPKRIVVDLRRNIGGNARLARPLVRALLRSDAALGDQSIAILIGQSTLSAAVVFSEEVSRFAEVAFIGEPTGSAPNQWGDNVVFALPNSGVRIAVSTMYYQSGGPYAWRDAIVPDYYIPLTSTDYFAVRDPVLEYALTFEREQDVLSVFEEASEYEGDPVSALGRFVNEDIRRFRDFERPLRFLARLLNEEGDIRSAIRVADILLERHPDRARSYMTKADLLAASGESQEASAMWRLSKTHIDNDPSLYPDLARRLHAYADNEISQLERAN